MKNNPLSIFEKLSDKLIEKKYISAKRRSITNFELPKINPVNSSRDNLLFENEN